MRTLCICFRQDSAQFVAVAKPCLLISWVRMPTCFSPPSPQRKHSPKLPEDLACPTSYQTKVIDFIQPAFPGFRPIPWPATDPDSPSLPKRRPWQNRHPYLSSLLAVFDGSNRIELPPGVEQHSVSCICSNPKGIAQMFPKPHRDYFRLDWPKPWQMMPLRSGSIGQAR